MKPPISKVVFLYLNMYQQVENLYASRFFISSSDDTKGNSDSAL